MTTTQPRLASLGTSLINAFMLVCFGYRVGDSWLKNQRDASAADAADSVTTTIDAQVVKKETVPTPPALPDPPKKKGR